MKKITLTAMVLAVACLFAACTKEGTFNPKEKISKVYSSSKTVYTIGSNATTTSVDKHLTQSWTWDGKLLKSINNYNNDGSLNYTVNFTYDGKQLTKIQNAATNEYCEMTYDGSKLTKWEVYDGTTLEMTATVTHDGKKVSKIDLVYYDTDKKNLGFINNITEMLMPIYTPATAKVLNTVATKGSSSESLTFTWDGKNISKVESVDEEGTLTIEYTYDEMKNPYQGFVMALMGYDYSGWGSQNNVVSETSKYSDGESYTYNYTYEYDDKWPVTKTYNYTLSEEVLGVTSSYSYTMVTYLEYDD